MVYILHESDGVALTMNHVIIWGGLDISLFPQYQLQAFNGLYSPEIIYLFICLFILKTLSCDRVGTELVGYSL